MNAPIRRPRAVSRSRRCEHPRQVVVIGASLAGAFAAAAASGPGRSVTVVERDHLPATPQPREGVPQGRQPHVFLHRGLLAVDELLPGVRADLRAAGAVPVDTGRLAWLGDLGWMPQGHHFEVLSASRPLFEHVVLGRVRALPGVQVRDGIRVETVRRGGSGGARWSVELADGSVLAADLVVDASGRASRLPVWLASAGVAPVRRSDLDARVGYASRTYDVEPGLVLAAGLVVQQSPETRAGGIALPVEGDRWVVGAVGSGDRRPPRDPGELDRFLAGLPDPSLAALARAGRPVGDVAVHRQTGNRRHHYEDAADWPAGLLVMGDALCAFDPLYGQGVTVAALEALELRRALVRGLRAGDERRLLRRFAAVAELPWAIATGEDRRFVPDADPQPRLEVLMGRWTRELGRLTTHGDLVAHHAVSRVYHLVRGPWSLLHPGLFARALRARVRGYGPPTPPPAMLREAAVVGGTGTGD